MLCYASVKRRKIRGRSLSVAPATAGVGAATATATMSSMLENPRRGRAFGRLQILLTSSTLTVALRSSFSDSHRHRSVRCTNVFIWTPVNGWLVRPKARLYRRKHTVRLVGDDWTELSVRRAVDPKGPGKKTKWNRCGMTSRQC